MPAPGLSDAGRQPQAQGRTFLTTRPAPAPGGHSAVTVALNGDTEDEATQDDRLKYRSVLVVSVRIWY